MRRSKKRKEKIEEKEIMMINNCNFKEFVVLSFFFFIYIKISDDSLYAISYISRNLTLEGLNLR